MLLNFSSTLIVRNIIVLVLFSTAILFVSSCVVLEKESAHKLIFGHIKTSSGIYEFKKVSRLGYERTHKKDGEWTFYANTGNRTFAYNARTRYLRIVVWPNKDKFEYVQNSGTIEQSDGEIYRVKINTHDLRNPLNSTFYGEVDSVLGRSDLEPSFGRIYILDSADKGYTGYPDDFHPVGIYLPLKLNGIEYELNLNTQKYMRRKIGLSNVTFTGNP